jgi:hypothetical protein
MTSKVLRVMLGGYFTGRCPARGCPLAHSGADVADCMQGMLLLAEQTEE